MNAAAMKKRMLERVAWTALLCLLFFTAGSAAEKFRYKFSLGDTLDYAVGINSDIKFPGQGGFTAMLGLDNLIHSADLDIELAVDSTAGDGDMLVKMLFKKVSIVIIAGDSVFTDNGAGWGGLRQGDFFRFIISPRGKINCLPGPDSTASRRAAEMLQRFFPLYPEAPIDTGYTWNDSVTFGLEMPGGKQTEIQSQIDYHYAGNVVSKDAMHLDFSVAGSSGDSTVDFSGRGDYYFDNINGYVTENAGKYSIRAEIPLSALGFPQGIKGGISADIKSDMRIKLTDER